MSEAAISAAASADNDALAGTYALVSSTRKILDTGEIVNSYGEHPKGAIIYGRDGRFLAMITGDGRPKPVNVAEITDQQRIDLYNTLLAYGGTYTFDGRKVEHKIDISWNEVWTGTTVVRDVAYDNGRLVYTTRPAPFHRDGKMSVSTLIWEKLE